jgi:hypothetical protein
MTMRKCGLINACLEKCPYIILEGSSDKIKIHFSAKAEGQSVKQRDGVKKQNKRSHRFVRIFVDLRKVAALKPCVVWFEPTRERE